MATFRLVLALAAQYGWDVDHMDVVMVFLNPKIDRENIYMKMRLGIDWLASSGNPLSGSALILRKALYALNRHPDFGMRISMDTCNPSVFVKVCPITVPLRVFTRREGERKDRDKAR